MVFINWKVYIHINNFNGKMYVGVTSRDNPKIRWGTNGRGYKENSHFYSAISKYGWDNFSHLIILDGLSEEEAKRIEMTLIYVLKTKDPKFGYNMTDGGDGTKGYYPSLETRKKLSVARKKENLSEETLRRRSEALRGRKLTDDHKRKIGASNSKPINMLTNNGEYIKTFASMKEAEIEMNINHSHISQCCNGQRKTAGNYCWEYASF